ncbi:hypothetical protein PILCRDRAFT_825729, partial [Piloderma croceum F 1598]
MFVSEALATLATTNCALQAREPIKHAVHMGQNTPWLPVPMPWSAPHAAPVQTCLVPTSQSAYPSNPVPLAPAPPLNSLWTTRHPIMKTADGIPNAISAFLLGFFFSFFFAQAADPERLPTTRQNSVPFPVISSNRSMITRPPSLLSSLPNGADANAL